MASQDVGLEFSEMSDVTIDFTDQLTVDYVDHMGNDLRAVNAAKVSLNQYTDEFGSKEQGLLNFLMKSRHASPFEHSVATFLVECPLFVRSEWHRHRTQSYNEWSGRYSEYVPRFYLPNSDRPLTQVGKPGAYTFAPGTPEQYQILKESYEYSATIAWMEYQRMLDAGIAKEVARNVLPVDMYTKFYATANLRNWLNFLSLRTDKNALAEIRDVAGQVETKLHRLFPACLNLWDEYGRGGL